MNDRYTIESKSPLGLLIIPAFNEEGSIGIVLEEASHYWPKENIIVVNDGSSDQTSRIVIQHGIREIKHPTNLGYGVALQTGILFAERKGYDFVITLDADGQHDPRYLDNLVQALYKTGSHLIIGSRLSQLGGHKDTPHARRIGMGFFFWVTKMITGQKLVDTTSGFKIIHSLLFPEIGKTVFIDFHAELLIYFSLKGYKIGQIPVMMRQRNTGNSLHNWTSAFSYPAKTILGILIAIADILVYKMHSRARDTSLL